MGKRRQKCEQKLKARQAAYDSASSDKKSGRKRPGSMNGRK